MSSETSEDRDRQAKSRLCDMAELKQLNSRVAALQNLVQDYSTEMMPQWISFTTTTFCNLQCPHCQTHGTEEVHEFYNAKHWPTDLVERLGRETLPYASVFCLSLSGEPLATPYLRKRLREFREYGAKLHLTTNATLLSKKTLARIIPLASAIHISIDGATERTCEAIRLGANFKNLIYNIKLLTRSCELLDLKENSPDLRLVSTVMASNVRDMPEMVSLARFLNVPAVDFFDLVVFFQHVRHEDMKLHKPLYNAYRERTQERAKSLNIAVSMPDAFPDVAPDANMKIQGTDLILGQQPDDFYDNLPPLESLVDLDAIEVDAKEVVDLIMSERAPDKELGSDGGEKESVEALKATLEGSLEELRKHYKEELEDKDGDDVPYCENLFKRTFVTWDGGVAPCCLPGRPTLGNVNENTMREIYNGEKYNNFRKKFFSSDPPDCCVGCRYFLRIPKKDLLNVID